MIGPPRGKKKTRQVFVWSAKDRKKVYVGTAPNWTEARKLEREWEVKIKGVNGPETVAEFSDRWLTEPRFREAHPRQPREVSTTRQHRGMIGQFVKQFGDRRFHELPRGEMLDFGSAHPHAAKVASAMLSDAVDAEVFAGPNPFLRSGIFKTPPLGLGDACHPVPVRWRSSGLTRPASGSVPRHTSPLPNRR